MPNIPVVQFGSALVYLTATSTSSSAADPDAMPNTGMTMISIRNNGTASRVIHIKEQRPCNYGHTTTHYPVTIAPGTELRVGTFRKDRYNSVAGKIEVWADTAQAVNLIQYGGVEVPREMGR